MFQPNDAPSGCFRRPILGKPYHKRWLQQHVLDVTYDLQSLAKDSVDLNQRDIWDRRVERSPNYSFLSCCSHQLNRSAEFDVLQHFQGVQGPIWMPCCCERNAGPYSLPPPEDKLRWVTCACLAYMALWFEDLHILSGWKLMPLLSLYP